MIVWDDKPPTLMFACKNACSASHHLRDLKYGTWHKIGSWHLHIGYPPPEMEGRRRDGWGRMFADSGCGALPVIWWCSICFPTPASGTGLNVPLWSDTVGYKYFLIKCSEKASGGLADVQATQSLTTAVGDGAKGAKVWNEPPILNPPSHPPSHKSPTPSNRCGN